MNEVAKSDIFFFITTIAVVLFTLFLIVGIYYLIKILDDIRYISKKAREGTDIISEDLSDLREKVKNNGAKVSYFTNFFKKMHNKKKRPHTKG